jgi:hypothetical protein
VKNDGGLVFPSIGRVTGITMRQLYKVMALLTFRCPDRAPDYIARLTASIADAMISEDEEAAK